MDFKNYKQHFCILTNRPVQYPPIYSKHKTTIKLDRKITTTKYRIFQKKSLFNENHKFKKKTLPYFRFVFHPGRK